MNKQFANLLIISIFYVPALSASHKGHKLTAFKAHRQLESPIIRQTQDFLTSIKQAKLLGEKDKVLNFCNFVVFVKKAYDLLEIMKKIEELQSDGYGYIGQEKKLINGIQLDFNFLDHDIANPTPQIDENFFLINDIKAVGIFFYVSPLLKFNQIKTNYTDALEQLSFDSYILYKKTDNPSIKATVATAVHFYLLHRFGQTLIFLTEKKSC